MAKISDKILIVVLAVVIISAAAVVVYTRLPDDEDGDTEEIALTVLYGGETWNYSIDDLKGIDMYSGSGGMSKKTGLVGPNDYEGVRFELILQDIGVTDMNSIEAKFVAVDGYNQTFSSDVILGNVTIYDATGNETNGTVTLIVAYEMDGAPISTEDGPLRSVFVSNQPTYTSSSYWIKQLTTIEVSQITS